MGPNNNDISDQERKAVYEIVFKKFAFGKPSLRLPRLILVGAQPGAGKSRVAESARRELAALGAPVMADIDDIRPEHPNVDPVFKEAPFKMASITNKECWGWTSQLLLDARHAKNNVIYQATIRQANRIEDLVKNFQKDDFAVDLYVVAANAKHSVLGIFKRFENAIQAMNMGEAIIPRWVPIPFHNAVYQAFPKNVDYLAENARLERVGVFSRDGADLYFSEDSLIHKGAGEALAKELKRPWSLNERIALHNSWGVLSERIKERPEGILKPKWYVRTAELYCIEARYYAEAQELCSHPAPSGVFVAYRTPNHHFVKDEERGLFVSYERARGDKTANRPSPTTPSAPKLELK